MINRPSVSDPETETARRFAPAQSPRQVLLDELPVTERRLGLTGISTAVLEAGEGPPLVLLHGPGGYAAHWMGVIPELSKAHRVIAPDLPGHGASDAGDAALDSDRVLSWLSELIDQTCAARPVLVGQLIGGAIAARFAIDHGVRLAGLVLIDTFGLGAFQPSPEFGSALNEFLEAPSEDTHDKLWRRCAHNLPGLRRRMGELWQPFAAYNLERAQNPGQQAAMGALMKEFAFAPIPAADLARISLPTTLIWGRHDLATPLAVAEAASARYRWPLHVIENANDDPPIEQPEALLSALQIALETAGARPA